MTPEEGTSITLDELAVMMNRSFEHLEKKMDEKFDNVDERFGNVEHRLDKVEYRLENVENRLESIENKVENRHEARITRLEDDMRVIKTSLGK